MVSTTSISPDIDTSEKYCVFECGNQVFAILATSISEVGLRPSLASVPNAHPSLVGLGRVRNEFVPLIRMDSTGAHTGEPQIVVISGDHGPWV